MNCFYHPTIPAAGVCRGCGKGLCVGCAADGEYGLACRGKCEARVAMMGRIFEMSARSAAVSNSALRSQALMLVVMGLAFSGFGVACHLLGSDFLAAFCGLLGGIMLLFGLVRLLAR